MARTFGEFFDVVTARAQANGATEALVHMRKWSEMDSGVTWEDARAMEFSGGLFLAFAEDMAEMFAELLERTSGEAAYARRMATGHEFLRAIAQTGSEFGLPQDVCAKADLPLSAFDAISRAEDARDYRSDGG